MRQFRAILPFLTAAILFWIVDTLLLTIISGDGFVIALWEGTTPGRLIFRLIVALALLLIGVTRVLRREMDYMRVLNMGSEAKISRFGSPDSIDRNQRMLYYALRIATLMKMSGSEQHNLRILCYCSDIGLVGVPANILAKRGHLTAAEQRIWDEHIRLGADILANIPKLARASRLIASHEEKYNGAGVGARYGKNIPLACRIFTAVEMFDRFTHPDNPAQTMTQQEALDELNLYAGTALDPDVVEAFHRALADHKFATALTVQVYTR